MALAITGVGGNSGIVQRVGAGVALDPDAAAWIAQVEAADGQALEPALVTAYNEFVVGSKADASPFPGVSNFDAIKASCIMAGARTLAGALVPLRGPAPTNEGFVSGDYNRVSGLKGDGVGKYLNANKANNDPQNNSHAAIYVTDLAPDSLICSGVITQLGRLYIDIIASFFRISNRSSTLTTVALTNQSLVGTSRAESSVFVSRVGKSSQSTSASSNPADNAPTLIFARQNVTREAFTASRLSFYSIGEAVDLAALDARVTTLQAAIAAALA
jgi:hypothetical protein